MPVFALVPVQINTFTEKVVVPGDLKRRAGLLDLFWQPADTTCTGVPADAPGGGLSDV